MKKTIACALLLIIILAACNLPGSGTPPPPPPAPTQAGGSGAGTGTGLQSGPEENSFWVTNPTSGARLFVRIFYPSDWDGASTLPTLVLMPGGIGKSDPDRAGRLSGRGFAVVIFDADGRGRSEGTEDYNGLITQDGLATVIRSAASLPGVDSERMGLVSYSYGVTAATGALARYPDLPIRFYIDWEGPVTRMYTTTGCEGDTHSDIPWQPCSDDAWWSEREALNFIADVQVPYQRIQSQEDHVQPNNNHAIEIVNAAVAGGVPWVRLNEYPPNQTYEIDHPPVMLPDTQDRHLEPLIADYASDILQNVLPAFP